MHKRRQYRPVRDYTYQNATLLEITCHGSFCLGAGIIKKDEEDQAQKNVTATFFYLKKNKLTPSMTQLLLHDT